LDSTTGGSELKVKDNSIGSTQLDAATDTVLSNSTTHIASNGSDHSFINQDVTISGTPSFASVSATTMTQNGNLVVDNQSVDNVTIESDSTTGGAELKLTDEMKVDNIPFRLNGNGFAIVAGTKYPVVEVPWNCTIVGARILLDQSATMTVDIWKDTYANYPPTNAQSITAAAPIGSTAAVKGEDTTLTGWNTTLLEGDILLINVDANDNAQFATIVIDVRRPI
jgi:hypothetical protein